MKDKLWTLLMNRFLKFSKGRPGPFPLGRQEKTTWSGILDSAGCEVFPYHFPTEDTEEDIFVRDVALGNIRVPREVAMKMLALGEIP